MKKNTANVPKLRFPGFTDDWEQRKLDDISDKVMTKNNNLEYMETFTNSAEYGVISQRDFFDKDISNEANLGGYYVVQNDDFVYNPRISTSAPVGPIKRNKLGRTGVMSPLYYVFKTHDIDNTFLETYFSTTGWHAFMKLNGDSGARADRFAIKDIVFREMPVPYPTPTEQQKIGEFFKDLDNLLTLHQRKLAHLQAKKKGLLQKMFPQQGECPPELRFPGFTDAWEQRKLGDFGKATGGTSIESEFTEGGKYKVISIGSYSEMSNYMDQGIRVDKTNKTESRILNKDDLTMILNDKTASGNIIGRVLLIDADNTYIYNQRTERIEVNKNEYEPRFLYQLLNADNIRSKIIRASQGNTQIYVNWSAISELRYAVPLSKSEQKQIGAFFHNFDNLITLHQRKLTHLQKQKKALLQQMFV